MGQHQESKSRIDHYLDDTPVFRSVTIDPGLQCISQSKCRVFGKQVLTKGRVLGKELWPIISRWYFRGRNFRGHKVSWFSRFFGIFRDSFCKGIIYIQNSRKCLLAKLQKILDKWKFFHPIFFRLFNLLGCCSLITPIFSLLDHKPCKLSPWLSRRNRGYCQYWD